MIIYASDLNFLMEKVVSTLVYEISPDDFDKYREFFNRVDFPQTWIGSAFEYKSVKLFVDTESNPNTFLLLYPYHAFIVGDPDNSVVHEMLDMIPEETQMHLNAEKWLPKLKEHQFPGTLLNKRRFKLSHQYLNLEDIARLKKPLPNGYSIERVDRETALRLPPILNVHISPFFGDIDSYLEKGIGFCVKHGDAPISMAGSCIPYTKKLEVQIATIDSPDYRRKGFGTHTAIALLEYCLTNDIEPHWDATNEPSSIMAEKLGYSNPEPYYVYKWVENFVPDP